MFDHLHMKLVLQQNETYNVTVQLGAYILETRRPNTLVGTVPYLSKMALKMTSLDRRANRRIPLPPDSLLAIAQLHAQCRNSLTICSQPRFVDRLQAVMKAQGLVLAKICATIVSVGWDNIRVGGVG